MSDTSNSEAKVIELQKKLDSVTNSRANLEQNIKYQTSLLSQFITKLSLTSKGLDSTLDKKLTALKTLLAKSATVAEIEKPIKEISLLLQKLSVNNEKQIHQIHDEFHSAAATLQKMNGLPEKVKRDLRTLLQESKEVNTIKIASVLRIIIYLFRS